METVNGIFARIRDDKHYEILNNDGSCVTSLLVENIYPVGSDYFLGEAGWKLLNYEISYE